MIFGQEQIGIPQDVLDMCDDVVYIPQYGSVRSINVGCASSIIMNQYCDKVSNYDYRSF
jgi:tRNA G18 (ribose-2'-O)-methylase SpoU